MDLAERARRCHDYVAALEEERRKIIVFQRELPLCLHLVTHTIESVRHQMGNMGSEATATASEEPVLEEFIPLKPSLSLSSEEESAHDAHEKPAPSLDMEQSETKPDWLRSVQLWNKAPEPAPPVEPPRKPVAVNARRVGGAFHPFEREKHVATPLPASSSAPTAAAAASSTAEGSGGRSASEKDMDKNKEKEGQSQSHRKARRCWSPELHRRFLHALQQLGGSHAATPKQIRELMKVHGLTNDEVKSHLQKYRLHTKRSIPGVQSSGSSGPPAPQFVVVGGIWMPPPDYTAVGAAAAAQRADVTGRTSGIYAPIALPPSGLRSSHQQLQQNKEQQTNGSSVDVGAARSVSPTTSSSSQTTTASLAAPL